MPTKSRTIEQIFADRLAELKGKDYTIQQFADTFGAKLNTVRDWLNARVLPRTEALLAIAAHFNVTTDWLLGVPGAPKYRGLVRETPDLARDLAVYVRSEALAGISATPWVNNVRPPRGSETEIYSSAREVLEEMLTGKALLAAIVQLAREESESTLASLHTRIRIGRAIDSLPAKGADDARKELRRAFATARPPSGRVFPWS